jgi:hypothetical protein
VLSKPAPEHPLMHDGTADVFEGLPAGASPRGDEITAPIVANMVAAGRWGQGKTNACRVVMLGCALDAVAELDVFVFANKGDFDAYAPRQPSRASRTTPSSSWSGRFFMINPACPGCRNTKVAEEAAGSHDVEFEGV